MQIKNGLVSGVLRVLGKLKAKSIEADEIIGNISGNATTATKLGTATKGSATQPIYLSAGTPTACTYTLGKSVPSDAKFTDTTYTLSSFGITATATELNYTDGVTSNIQTQLNGKAASSHNQAASTITAGTFGGQVVAGASNQTYSTSLLRNSKLVSAETNPTNNGEIFWLYE